MSNDKKVKTSKLLACDPYGEPYDLLPTSPDIKNGQGYMLVFENGDEAVLASHIPAAHGPSSNGFTIVIGTEYRYTTSMSKKVSGLMIVDVLAATTVKDIAQSMPGVTTASQIPEKQEKVSPQLRPTDKKFEDTAAATKKITPEELAASVKIHPNKPIPDNQPRKGTVQLLKHSIETFDKGTTTKVKWYVTMEDGAKGIMWSDSVEDQPVKVGQEYNYVFDKAYAEAKRIAIVPSDSSVDKETMIMRMACVNSAIALLAIPDNIKNANYEPTLENTIVLAKYLEAHVMRSID